MDNSLFTDKEKILAATTEKLGRVPIDFAEKIAFIRSTEGSEEVHLAAGVLLLLRWRDNANGDRSAPGEFSFELIKRSTRVAQAGDLSCPGGMLHRVFDPLLSRIVRGGLIPTLRGAAGRYARARGDDSYRAVSLFLANALRESWEEMGLNPCNITFLGPLPCYSLVLFRRTIFPLVGVVRNDWRARPNYEVDKVVEIPLRAFFAKENYACFAIQASPDLVPQDDPRVFPCLVHRDAEGVEEVLWGATFNIIMQFLSIVFDFTLPDFAGARTVRRTLRPEYLTGKRR